MFTVDRAVMSARHQGPQLWDRYTQGPHGIPLPFDRIFFVVLVMKKEGAAVEVVPGMYAVHWKFSMCTATRTSSYSPVGPSEFLCVYI